MQHKKLKIFALVIIAIVAFYIAWPDSSAPSMGPDSSSVAAKMMDRLAEKFPFMVNSSIDTRTVINGVKVPPMPDPKINNATLGGVDTDNNGIRDDVDRMIAEKFGGDKHIVAAQNYAKAYQNMILNPNEQTKQAYLRELACGVNDSTWEERSAVRAKMSPLDLLAVNTRGRMSNFGRAIPAGTEFKQCGAYQ